MHVKSFSHSLTNQNLPHNQPLHTDTDLEHQQSESNACSIWRSSLAVVFLSSSALQCPCSGREGLRALCWSFWEVKSLCASLDGPLHLSPWLMEGGGTEREVNKGLGIGEEWGWRGRLDGELDFVAGWVVLDKAVGLGVVLVEPTDAVHLVVDAAGNVFNVLHVGSAGYEPITR